MFPIFLGVCAARPIRNPDVCLIDSAFEEYPALLGKRPGGTINNRLLSAVLYIAIVGFPFFSRGTSDIDTLL